MSCKRHRFSSSLPVSEDKNDNKKPKLKIPNSKRPDAKESDSESVEIQSVKDDPSKIEDMTVKQLRMALRNAGMPVKGPKSELIASLKSFKARHLDAESSQEAEEHVCSVHTEKTFLQTKSKRRMKPSCAKAESVTSDAITSTTEENCQLTQKRTQTRRKISCPVPDAEPWTVLAHKKPQKGWIPYNPRTMRRPPLAEDTKFVKLMSWNVNGLRALLKLEEFSAVELGKRENFDVLCLQETKLQEKDVEAIKQCLIDGYENSFWTCSQSKLGYSGTAIVSRMKPLSVSYGLGIADHDSEGRLVMVEFDSFYLINAYVPNSGDGLRRLSYRVEQWDSSLGNYMKELEKSKPVILTGDLNCAHQEIDIYNPAGNRRSAGFTDEERQSFETNFLSRGFVDTFRKQHPDTVAYTYWGYRHGARKTNKGWRLDYFLVSESIADQVHDSYIVPDFNGSDHCPIGLILKV